MSGLTLIHVILSLLAILSGIRVAQGLMAARRYEKTTLFYMLSTALTLVTSFLFPYNGVTPGIIVGIICVLIFVPTAFARYMFHMAGIWRPVFVVGALALLYFNCLVLIVQSFQKIPSLNALAPTGGEPPVTISQAVLLVIFLLVGFFSVRRFRPTLMGI
jgi:hypothetical protein